MTTGRDARTESGGFLPSRLCLDAASPYRIPTWERASLLRLDVNEHPGGAPEFVLEALRSDLTPAAIATYPVYAEWHAAAARVFGVRPDQITCTAGADEAIKAICEAHLMPGTALATHDPGFDMFPVWARLYGNPLRRVAFGPGFAFDRDAWFAALEPGLGMVALVTPANPTGTLIPREAIVATLDRVTCPVLVDETYADFVGLTVADLIPKYAQLFVLRSFSKVAGLAGLRAGAVLSQAQNIEAIRRVLNPFNVNRAAIVASLAVMHHPQEIADHVAEVTVARAEFAQGLAQLGVRVGPSHANFLLAHLGDKASACEKSLRGEGILIRNRTGSHPTLDGWARIAIGSREQMQRCLGALRKVLLPSPQVETLLFDLDGPLADVRDSYRQAILRTARALLSRYGASHATVAQVTPQRVEELKRRGGLNNDWDCTAALIADLGGVVPHAEVVDAFQSLYWGDDGDGLIAGEPFRLSAEDLAWTVDRFRTGVVTGRPRVEALWTLQRHGVPGAWPVVVAMEDMTAQKPAPDGILQALKDLKAIPATAAYLGDSVDDMRAAVAAGVLPIGVLPAGADWNDGLCERLYQAGAWAVFGGVEEVLAWLRK